MGSRLCNVRSEAPLIFGRNDLRLIKPTYNNATLPDLLIPNHVPPAMMSMPDRTSPSDEAAREEDTVASWWLNECQ